MLCQGEQDEVESLGGVRVYRIRPYQISRAVGTAPVRFVNQCFAIHNPFVASQVRRVLDDFRPHVCHLQMLRRLTPAVVAASRHWPEVAVVQTVHELFSLWNFNAFQYEDSPGKIYTSRPLIVGIFKWRHRLLSARVDHLCAPSAFALTAYQDDGYFDGVPSSVMPPGVPSLWGDPEKVAAARHAALGRDAVTSYLFIGRLDFYKGVDLLLDVMATLPNPLIRLDIAGDGPMVPAVQARAKQDQRIVFHGPVENSRKRALFLRADVLVCPSTWVETFGLVIAEAYACAMPCIVSRVGALAELVEDGVTGIVVEAGSASQLRNAMLALCDSARREPMINRCAVRAEAFRLETFIERQIAVYGAALARRASACRCGAQRR